MFVVKAKSDFAAKRMEYIFAASKQEKLCDSVFNVRDRNFYVHLIVLSACSEFFGINEGLVSGILSDFDFEVIDAILKYCYTGEINIDDRHYEKLMELAGLLEVKIPPQFKTVDLSNCLEVLKLADDSELKTKAMDLTLENFETLHKTQEFLNLAASTVFEILKSDDLATSSEEDVFNSIKLWINYDDANREKELAQLIRSVRLSLLSSEYLVNEVMKFCNLCEECMISLRRAVLERTSPNNKSSIQNENRRGKKEKIVQVGGVDLDIANTIDIYDGQNNSWTLLNDVGFNKSRFASVIVGNWMLIISGSNSSYRLVTSVEYIDLKDGQKHSLKPINHARCNFSAVTLLRDSSNDVYVIGGYGTLNVFLSSVERWNSKHGEWEIIAPLLVALEFLSASVITDDEIYVTGGLIRRDGKDISSNIVQMYSVESNSWTYRANMIHPRYKHSSVVFRGKLFVCGGQTDQINTYLDSVEQYDPVGNLWTEFSKLPKPVFGNSLCCLQNKIICMGGHDGLTYSSDVWEYDETSKSWKASKSLNKSRYLSSAHVIPYGSIIRPN